MPRPLRARPPSSPVAAARPEPPPVDPFPEPRRIVVAVGGNAIHPGGIQGTAAEQRALAEQTGRALLGLMRRDNVLVVTHGNGPVVGKILMRQALARDRVAPMPLDVCVAHSQGGIAYLLVQALENTLRAENEDREVVCLLTQVEVDPDDPAFETPTKPIGYFYEAEESEAIAATLGWTMREDAGRGWRHVVPSPAPRRVAFGSTRTCTTATRSAASARSSAGRISAGSSTRSA